ncbi:MAG: 23S rRNA (pseudouridine(1915)-N(3))-methyltransferase RlmH [Bacteroidetes bacterium]|nr:23S rRNA (pseudouridine(1915)-N(3))-methyltransferase RlmH [Bacteroidota bacterium]
MKISLIQIDSTRENYLNEGINEYNKRLKNYCRFNTVTINMPKTVRLKPQSEQLKAEAKAITETLLNDDKLVLLDERGDTFTSVGFSQFLLKQQNASIKHLVFCIGGPFGFSEEIYKRANYKMSLSQLTFSHQMVRLFFCEQLYRAFTILNGEKYHHL